MKTCPHCQHPIEDSARFCLYCATSLDEKRLWAPRRRYPRLYKTIALLCVLTLTVGAVLLWPREELPLTDTPAAGIPVDGIAAESGTGGTTTSGTAESGTDGTTTPSLADGSTTLTDAPTTTTKAGLLSFIDNLFGRDTTTTEKATTTATKKPTSSTTKPSTTTTTIKPNTPAYNFVRTPIETPEGVARVIGERFYARDSRWFDLYAAGTPYAREVEDLYVEIADINCYMTDYHSGTLQPYIDLVLWIPPSNYEFMLDSAFCFKMCYADGRISHYIRIGFVDLHDLYQNGCYITLTHSANQINPQLGGSLAFRWEICPDDDQGGYAFVPLGSQGLQSWT